MIPNEARKAIYMRFLDNIEDVDLHCGDPTAEGYVSTILDRKKRITFDNEKFVEPTDGRWVRLAVRHTGRSQETLGGKGDRRFRSFGLVFAQVFTEAGQHMLVADCIAQAIVDVFDAVTFDGLAFEAATSREGGAEGKWNMVIVEAPFAYDDVK